MIIKTSCLYERPLNSIYATNAILMLWLRLGIHICFKVVYAFNNAKTN